MVSQTKKVVVRVTFVIKGWPKETVEGLTSLHFNIQPVKPPVGQIRRGITLEPIGTFERQCEMTRQVLKYLKPVTAT